MALKYAKPINSSTRQLIQVKYVELTKDEKTKHKPLKTLTKGLSKAGGRNNHGRLTAFRKGGGHKRKYRLVDFKRKTIPKGVVKEISYDPNRTAFIAEVRSVVNSNDAFYILTQMV